MEGKGSMSRIGLHMMLECAAHWGPWQGNTATQKVDLVQNCALPG